MKKHTVRIITALLTAAFVMSFAGAAAEAPPDGQMYHYVAMGDSISAYFRVEKGQGYAEILADFLSKEPGFEALQLTNLSKSGDDSTDILNMADAYADAIRGANLITISIGGNNFLGPLLSRIYGFLEEHSVVDFLSEGFELSGEFLGEMAAALDSMNILDEVANGISRLNEDIAALITKLNGLSPSADIFFMTVYNPMSESDAVYAVAEMLIKSVNSIIEAQAELGYTVVDVYSAFREVDAKGLSFIDMSAGSFDPHPNRAGHRLIAGAHFEAITGSKPDIPEDYAPVVPLKRSEAVSGICESVYDFYLSIIYNHGVPASPELTDVPSSHPQYNQISMAASFGIIRGVGGGLFLPDEYMTRQDYAVALSRLFEWLARLGLDFDLPGAALADIDFGSIPPYARDALAQFAGTPLLPLIDGAISPLSPVTSSELAELKVLIASH